MTRRPDWHPSYGTPIPPTLRERQQAVRARLGIPEPEPNYRVRGWINIIALCGALACFGWSGWATLGCFTISVWANWPIFRDPDARHRRGY